mmetsp:Transcript_1730/g.3828  ORF Transcript_1730/g.3828 Transcript_1730/m.3828 type:complete len:251 (+) Transcript_1730:1733-2485(+)
MGLRMFFMALTRPVARFRALETEPKAPVPSFFFSISYKSSIWRVFTACLSSRPALPTFATQQAGPPASICTRYFLSLPSPVIFRTVPSLPLCGSTRTSTLVFSGKGSGSASLAALEPAGGGAPLPPPLGPPLPAGVPPFKAAMRGDTTGCVDSGDWPSFWASLSVANRLTWVVQVALPSPNSTLYRLSLPEPVILITFPAFPSSGPLPTMTSIPSDTSKIVTVRRKLFVSCTFFFVVCWSSAMSHSTNSS